MCSSPGDSVPPLIDTFLDLHVGLSHQEYALTAEEFHDAYKIFLRDLVISNGASQTSTLAHFIRSVDN